MGVKKGCLILLTFSILSNFNLVKWVSKGIQLHKLLKYFKTMLIVICLSSVTLFMYVSQQSIILLAVLIGIADSIYTNEILPQIIRTNPAFESFVELVSTLEKIVILCPMPFFTLMFLRMDDVKCCLVCISFLITVFSIVSSF